MADPVHDAVQRRANDFEALRALYENKQQWVRHYETLLAQLTPVGTTANMVICAYLADNYERIALAGQFLLVPMVLIGFTLWFNWWCDAEIKRQFSQIVAAETGMGFYNIVVDGNPVLPHYYKESGHRMRPIVVAGYFTQAISMAVLALTALFLFTR